jgi:acyl-CoA synthetase (AMP-forming)/AMP-acid ligase II
VDFKSLCDVFHIRCCEDNTGITFIHGENDEEFISYKELHGKALSALSGLQKTGLEKGQELVMQIEDNKTFIIVFWACILGGIIPVPVTVGNNPEHKLKIFRIWDVLINPFLIISNKTFLSLEKYAVTEGMDEGLKEIKDKTIFIDRLDFDTESANAEVHEARPEDIAFIQFSSGSTGDPKGVVLTHENLTANITAIIKGGQYVPGEKSLSWMPLTHDMGLIGFHITPLAAGAHQYLMPTSLFIRRPVLWMKKVNQHKVAITSSPNFGYKYFLDLFKPETASHWDLSGVRLIFNGAEPISYDLCTRFLKAMSCYGLRENVMFNVYGLAEACLAVSFPPPGEGIAYMDIDRKKLAQGQTGGTADNDNTGDSIRLIDLGYAVENCSIRVCDEENNELGENVVGHIQIFGKNVTRGYYNNKEATEKAFTHDGWLVTGDLGLIRNGRLIVTGRAKDIIFVNGQNYYPHDIERVAEDIEGISLGEVAVCGVPGSEAYTESACLFVLFKKEMKDFIPLAARLKEHIVKKTGIEIKDIIPIKKCPKQQAEKFKDTNLQKDM